MLASSLRKGRETEHSDASSSSTRGNTNDHSDHSRSKIVTFGITVSVSIITIKLEESKESIQDITKENRGVPHC